MSNDAQVSPASGPDLTTLANLIEAKQWAEAQDEFGRLRQAGAPSARLLLMGSHVAHGNGDMYGARDLAERAMASLRQDEPPELLGKIRFHWGLVSREVGDVAVALEQFDLFLSELPKKYPILVMAEGKAHFLRALTLRQMKHYEEALQAYQQASVCFRRDGLDTLLCHTFQNTAWLLCRMPSVPDRRVLAWTCLRESASLVKSPVSQRHQTLGEAHLYLLEGNYTMATRLCESLFHLADIGEEVGYEVRSQAAWISGTVAMHQRNYTAACALAKAARCYAQETKDARLINDANDLLNEIKQRNGGELPAETE